MRDWRVRLLRDPEMTPLRLAAIFALLTWAAPGEARPELRTSVYASGFHSPVAFVQDPTDHRVQYVVQQNGHVRAVQNGSVLATDFLDLSGAVSFGGEQGLLGMAFAPDYVSSLRFFVNFTAGSGNTVVARFKRSNNPLIADAASRFDLHWGGASDPCLHFPAVRESQRRQPGLRLRWLPLHWPGRWWIE